MPENARNTHSSFILWMQFHFNHILAAFSGRFNASFTAFRTSAFHLIRIQFIASFNGTIALIIPILINFLQLKKTVINFLQLKKTDPFSTHPKTMCLAVSTTLVFYMAHIALLRYPLRRRFAIIAGHCLLSVGNTAVASLVSVLLPDSLSPLVFAMFGLLSATEFLCWLYQELVADDDDVRRMRVSLFFDNIWTAFGNIVGQQQPILPV